VLPLPPPLEAEERGAEQVAAEPPFDPAQLQFHGPLPLTAEAEPVVQSPLAGALLTATPFAEPHAPFTGAGGSFAAQIAMVPPLLPRQLQFQGPLPVTVVAVPALQRLGRRAGKVGSVRGAACAIDGGGRRRRRERQRAVERPGGCTARPAKR